MPNASQSGPGVPRIVLHIGAMKTGTTFLQQLLADHRASLARRGFAVPREQGVGLRSILAGAHEPGRTGRQARVARRLLRAVHEYDGPSLVSWEFLSFLDRDKARRLLDDLDVGVDVILTVRDAARTMPAQWQTRCRNGTTTDWPRFAASIGAWLEDGRPSSAARVFDRTQGIPRMLDVWTDVVGADRLRVVTVPASADDRLLLWDRFAEAAGVDPPVHVSTGGVRHNPSLGYPSCELLRRINKALGPEVPDDCGRLIRAVVAPDLEAHAEIEARVRLDGPGLAVAAAWNSRTVEAIRRAGVRVVGDLETDLPTRPPVEGASVPPPTDEELLAAAATTRASLGGLGATPASDAPVDIDAAVADLAAMIRATAGIDLTTARRARGRGRG